MNDSYSREANVNPDRIDPGALGKIGGRESFSSLLERLPLSSSRTVNPQSTPVPFSSRYIDAAGVAGQPNKAPLFRTAMKRKRQLTERALTSNDILRIVKRRLKAAGLSEGTFSCHSFRATTATALLEDGISREQVQYLLDHSDARTTDLYNRTDKKVSRNTVERIPISLD